MGDYRITVSMPCYGRPQRTMRAIKCILNQTIPDYEALIVGDNCPNIQSILDNLENLPEIAVCPAESSVVIENLDTNYGGWGYHITNLNIQRAKGDYFLFMANDDIIEPNHFESRLKHIEGSEYDFVYFNTKVRPDGGYIRKSKLEISGIGHSELIIRTDFLKRMPPHQAVYGHDWHLIDAMMRMGAKYKYVDDEPTYTVMNFPHDQEEID
jgi:glycosyltransferase involved in cell wall biosynthesis